MIALRAILAGLLLLSGVSVCSAAELIVVAVDAYQKADLTKQHGHWSPYLALSLKPIKKRVDVENRTEFHAFLIDTEDRLEGKTVTFTWRHQKNMVLFARPVKKLVRRIPGHAHPMATYYAWSKPGSGSGILGLVGLRSVYSQEEWNRSRCYGPRKIVVTGPDGKMLAEKYFEIHAPGVKLY